VVKRTPSQQQAKFLDWLAGHGGEVPALLEKPPFCHATIWACELRGWSDFDPDDEVLSITDAGRQALATSWRNDGGAK